MDHRNTTNTTACKKANVLFIDDSEIDNDYIKLLIEIEEIPIESQFQFNGALGVEHLATLSREEFPDLIFVDINMPAVDGFDFVDMYTRQFARQYPDTKVYIMSSTRRLSEIERARNHPVVEDFIEKPINKSHFNGLL